jgi:hypothetical protein
MGFQIPGTLDKFLTKFQEVHTKLKKIFLKFRDIIGIPGDLGTLM